MNKAQKVIKMNEMLQTGALWPADAQLHQSPVQSRKELRELVKEINSELAPGSPKLVLAAPDSELLSIGGDISD